MALTTRQHTGKYWIIKEEHMLNTASKESCSTVKDIFTHNTRKTTNDAVWVDLSVLLQPHSPRQVLFAKSLHCLVTINPQSMAVSHHETVAARSTMDFFSSQLRYTIFINFSDWHIRLPNLVTLVQTAAFPNVIHTITQETFFKRTAKAYINQVGANFFFAHSSTDLSKKQTVYAVHCNSVENKNFQMSRQIVV